MVSYFFCKQLLLKRLAFTQINTYIPDNKTTTVIRTLLSEVALLSSYQQMYRSI